MLLNPPWVVRKVLTAIATAMVLATGVACSGSAWAQPSASARAAAPPASAGPGSPSNAGISAVDSLDALDRWRRMLAEERAVLERQADRQYAGLEKIAERGIWVGGIFVTAALAWIVWFFGKTKSETRATVKEMFEQQAKQLLESEATLLREQYQALRAEVQELSAYRNRPVVWVVGSEATALNPRQLPAIDRVTTVLHGAGIGNISRVEPDPGTPFDIGNPDLVVLSFDGSEESRHLLRTIVEALKMKAPPVPLLIYTHAPGAPQVRLEASDIELLDGFDWYVPVNFPAQLVAQVQVLLRRTRSGISPEANYG